MTFLRQKEKMTLLTVESRRQFGRLFKPSSLWLIAGNGRTFRNGESDRRGKRKKERTAFEILNRAVSADDMFSFFFSTAKRQKKDRDEKRNLGIGLGKEKGISGICRLH